METYDFISHSESETKKFAFDFASKTKVGDVIVLSGDLGSGKTKFTEGFLKFFNLDSEVSSPTFTIVNEYKNKDINIYHFDVYRLADVDEFYAIGGDEYFSSGISLIEWGELVEDALPKEYTKISFSKNSQNDDFRVLHIESVKK